MEVAKMKKKSFIKSKAFGVIALLYGIFGLLVLAHHIISYNNILVPVMNELIENKVITNDINGPVFLCFFTNQSNIFVDVYLILYAIGLFGSKKLYAFTQNEKLRGAVTLYIAITGIIYCAVLMPFQTQTFADFTEQSPAIWFSYYVNMWQHMLTPAVFIIFWFLPLNKKKLPVVKTSLYYLIYPMCYFIFSIFHGKLLTHGIVLEHPNGFYPYPFLNPQELWGILFKAKEYEPVTGMIIFIAVFIALCAIFFGVGCGIVAIHNARCGKKAVEADKAAV